MVYHGKSSCILFYHKSTIDDTDYLICKIPYVYYLGTLLLLATINVCIKYKPTVTKVQ